MREISTKGELKVHYVDYETFEDLNYTEVSEELQYNGGKLKNQKTKNQKN